MHVGFAPCFHEHLGRYVRPRLLQARTGARRSGGAPGLRLDLAARNINFSGYEMTPTSCNS